MQRKLAPFVFLQLSSVASIVSGSMVYIAIPWIALELSGSSSTAGLIVAITAVPTLLLAPFIGSFIDKFGRRKTAIGVEILAGLVALLVPIVSGLWELTVPALIAIGILWAIIVPGEFKWPQETQNIYGCYPKFNNWARSKGALDSDWYLTFDSTKAFTKATGPTGNFYQ